MGGGVCWDRASCFSVIPKAWIYQIPNVNGFSVFTSKNKENPFKHHTMIYFPYCTGDVHAGDLIEHYGKKKVHHYGYINTLLTLKHLKEKKIIHFEKFKDVIVWGASAGALASLIHGKNIERLLNPAAKKTMLIDSPGLHFGENFWKKFSPRFFQSYQKAFSLINLNIDYNDGLVAKDMAPVFENYHNWQMGFFLGTQDIVMSKGYGDITPLEQEKLIFSSRGLPAIAAAYANIDVWLRRTRMHTFFVIGKTSRLTSIEDETAIDFARNIYQFNGVPAL